MVGMIAALVGGLGATTSSTATAQLATDRALLGAFWDSLGQSIDSVSIDLVRRDLTRERKRGDDPLVSLEEGFAELRLSAMGRPERSRDAEKAFKRARKANPTWPYPWYGQGLAKLAQARWQMDNTLNIGNRVGVGAMEDAQAAFLRAVTLDPTFEPALVELGRVALRLRTPERLTEALATMRAAHALESWSDPELHLLLGRLEHRVGDADSALTAFDLLERSGGPMGVVYLERARVFLAAGDSLGIRSYYRGAGSSNAEAVAGYRRDIQPIAHETELARFDSATGSERVDVLRAFWERRDDQDLRPTGTRIREHYRRLAYVRRYFWLDVTRRHYWAEARFASEQLEFDDRGIVYLRHGTPSFRVTPFLYGSTANESWRYDRVDGEWFFHFCTQGDLRDYRLIESAVDISFSRCNTGGVQIDQLLMSRYELSPMYTRMATWGRHGRARVAREERNLGRASIAEGTTSDSYELRYVRSLPVVIRPLVVGRQGQQSILHVAIAVGDLLPSTWQFGAATIPLRLRFSAFDDDGNAVGRIDTTVVRRVDPAQPGVMVLLDIPLPVGRWIFRLAVESGDSAGTLLRRDTVEVHDFMSGLEISDLMVGAQGSAAWVTSPVDTAFVDPEQTFQSNQFLELYYEVYGLEAGVGYQTRLEVRRKKTGLLDKLFGGTPSTISFHFEELARAERVRARRTIDLDPLEPGTYWLEIEIIDGNAHSVTRRTELVIKNPADLTARP